MMTTFSLPDINVWLALAYAGHPHCKAAAAWFDGITENDVVKFCRVTQMGLLRLLTQRAVVGSFCLTQAAAWAAYEELLMDPRVSFQGEPLNFDVAFRRASSRMAATPKLWTDDYLVALTHQIGLTLVTFDRSLSTRAQNALLLKSAAETTAS